MSDPRDRKKGRWNDNDERLCDDSGCHELATHALVWSDGWHCYCHAHASKMVGIGLALGFDAPQSTFRALTSEEMKRDEP